MGFLDSLKSLFGSAPAPLADSAPMDQPDDSGCKVCGSTNGCEHKNTSETAPTEPTQAPMPEVDSPEETSTDQI